MVTNKPRVAGYVSQELKDLFQAFTKERQLSESKALGVLLAEYFGVNHKVAHPSSLDLIKRIEALEAEVFRSGKKSAQVFAKAKRNSLEPETSLLFGESSDESPSNSPPAKADNKRWLVSRVAHERAVARGCDRNVVGFKSWARRNPQRCIKDFGLRLLENRSKSNIAPTYEDLRWGDELIDF